MQRAAIALTACLLAGSASASVTWKGDFETGNLSQWDELEGRPERIGAVTSPKRQGAYAARFELRYGDTANGGTRNELDHAKLEDEGSELYYSWSTMFAADYPSAATWQVFTQWHHTGSSGSPPVEFDVEGEKIELLTGGDKIIWSAPLVRGVWHDFIFHVVWSSSSSTGLMELWYDGQRVLAPLHAATLYAGQQVYLKQGLYRDATVQPTAVVFHDGMTIATTLADVTPAPPPAGDAGTPDAGSGTPDAGTPDAGTPDAGTPDAGSGTPDAGPAPSPDAGPADAGSTAGDPPPPAADAGGTEVATSSLASEPGGCSTAGGNAWLLFGLGAALLCLRRQRR